MIYQRLKASNLVADCGECGAPQFTEWSNDVLVVERDNWLACSMVNCAECGAVLVSFVGQGPEFQRTCKAGADKDLGAKVGITRSINLSERLNAH